MKPKRYRVTIAKAPRGTGFRPAEGWVVRVNRREVGHLSPNYVGWGPKTDGWFFVVRADDLGIPLRNTCSERGVPEEDAKQAAIAYVKRCLAERGGRLVEDLRAKEGE